MQLLQPNHCLPKFDESCILTKTTASDSFLSLCDARLANFVCYDRKARAEDDVYYAHQMSKVHDPKNSKAYVDAHKKVSTKVSSILSSASEIRDSNTYLV